MKSLPLLALFFVFALRPLCAAEQLVVNVTHDLEIARPSETISVSWADVAKALPGAQIQHLAVKDASGASVPFQVTNVNAVAKGQAYGELLFQYSFKAGEKSAAFTIEKIEAMTPVFPSKAYCRYVPERLDDFAWENDKIAHRIYGPALAAPAAGSGKEVLITSAIDVWAKRVDYPIIDRWYNKGHDQYHTDQGEGMDLYQAGISRGCGGTGIWDGKQLYVSRNYKSWKVIANGPVRAVFELTYDSWDANGSVYTEVKRFSLDAGSQLSQVESTFVAEKGSKNFTIAIGVNKNSGDKNQENKSSQTAKKDEGWFTQWEIEKTNGSLGEAVIVASAPVKEITADNVNHLVVVDAVSGQPVRYFIGAGWSKRGDFATQADWDRYVAAFAARAKAPVRVSVAAK